MGRALLIALAAASLAACAVDETTSTQAAAAEGAAVATDPHAELPCAACHTGGLTDGRRAAVPKESCATSGCHQEGGPPEVSTATATFNHRDHGQDGEIAMACAGCHTHDDGAQPLRVSSDGCALCHLTDLRSSQPDDCRLCHQQPKHVAMSSQALPIPHSALPWVETGCVRCHYDVAEPATRVTLARCTDCHVNDTTVIAKGIGSDLHPSHTALTCTACHESGAHHVRAMSSAVQLACADCHVTEHGISLPDEWRDDGVCGDCHSTVHQAQQRLLLGVLPDGGSAPSSKFIAGITCRSCHLRNERTTASGYAIRGQAEACAGCHQ
ncbi:MAG TPA: cytochrome c3 family protein, partial [Longimicrobiales bacterium]|nr:cytochrome c3 family protein [Longimicrobiales bacterium]